MCGSRKPIDPIGSDAQKPDAKKEVSLEKPISLSSPADELQELKKLHESRYQLVSDLRPTPIVLWGELADIGNALIGRNGFATNKEKKPMAIPGLEGNFTVQNPISQDKEKIHPATFCYCMTLSFHQEFSEVLSFMNTILSLELSSIIYSIDCLTDLKPQLDRLKKAINETMSKTNSILPPSVMFTCSQTPSPEKTEELKKIVSQFPQGRFYILSEQDKNFSSLPKKEKDAAFSALKIALIEQNDERYREQLKKQNEKKSDCPKNQNKIEKIDSPQRENQQNVSLFSIFSSVTMSLAGSINSSISSGIRSVFGNR
jgi:hypothetical protein